MTKIRLRPLFWNCLYEKHIYNLTSRRKCNGHFVNSFPLLKIHGLVTGSKLDVKVSSEIPLTEPLNALYYANYSNCTDLTAFVGVSLSSPGFQCIRRGLTAFMGS